MANLTRKNQKVFAENAVNNGQFGSLQDTTKVLTQDLDVLQANSAYELGWNNATISGEKLPALEEFQSLNYINTSQIAYLLNKGIPEWVADAEYYIGDIQREVAGTKIYRSITNNNIGNILTNITHWALLVDLALTVPNATETVAGVALLNKQITIANNIADPNNDINFGAGNFTFSDFSGQAVATAMTKRLDAAWVAGNNQGGLDTGAKAANTWYHCYAIHNLTTLVTDFIFSTNAATPILPSGFTKYKRVGSIKTNASNNILAFKQRKDYFEWKDVVLDLSIGSVVATRTNFTISTPLGIEVIANIRTGSYIGAIASDLTINLLSTYNNILTPLSGDGQSYDSDIGSDITYVTGTNMQIATDSSSQISYIASRATALNLPLVVRTKGYYDYSIL
jgi:hypothetical protein